MTATIEQLEALIERCHHYPEAYLDRRQLDLDVCAALGVSWDVLKPVTSIVDSAAQLIAEVFPGWWYTCGSCHVSDDATIAPDYSDPAHRDRLLREFPLAMRDDGTLAEPSPFDSGFSYDISPALGIPARAIVACILEAKIYILGGGK